MERIQSQAATPQARSRGNRYIALLVIGDIIAFLVFAAIGRRSHGEAAGLTAMFEVAQTAAPFIIGWFLAAPFLKAYRLDTAGAGVAPARRTALVGPLLKRTALAWLVACPIGLVLRALFLSRGIPLSFAIITFITNLFLLGGWRSAFAWFVARRARGPAA